MTVNGYDYINGVQKSVNALYTLATSYVPIRLMQYNCGKWAMGGSAWPASGEVAQMIKNYKMLFGKYQPDAVGIEEWLEVFTVDSVSYNMNDLVFDSLYPYKKDDIPSGSTVKGRTIKSKRPFISSASGSVAALDANQQTIASTRYSKVVFDHYGKQVAAVCAAFSPSGHLIGDPEKRLALMPKLFELLDGEEYAFLITDLNNGGDAESTGGTLTPIDEGNMLNNAAYDYGFSACMGPDWVNSWQSQSNKSIWKPIDQIYFRNNGKIILQKYTVLTSEFELLNSDHIPCIGDFILR